MPMPAACACCLTVFISQRSASPRGSVMTWAPTEYFAMVFDNAREMNAPPMPKTAQNASSP